MKVDDHCPICRDFYDDAVMARDGFAYCRECILQWAGHGERIWKSPRTNELVEGHPVLRGDVERNCAAKELRKKELLEGMQEDAEVLQALDVTHCHVPLLGKADCEKLLWHPVILTSPYVHLAIAHRAAMISEVPSNVIREVCRLDRCAVTVPLLEMSVLSELLKEAIRRCDVQCGEDDVKLLKQVKAHLLWRGRGRDAIEIPANRTHLERLSGVYHRDWHALDAKSILFVKGNGIREPRYHLVVPVLSDLSRGCCERQLQTCIYAEASLTTVGDEDCTLHAAFSSEVPLRRDGCHWRSRRGDLPFPDSRGGDDSEEEDWEEQAAQGCVCLFEKVVKHLPKGFVYHCHHDDVDHWFELMAEVSIANETLLRICRERSTDGGNGERLWKRQRVSEGV